jgi:acyl phosphate:glycerol-3-phosphate acyltransferase
MIISIFLLLGIISGFILFKNVRLSLKNQPLQRQYKISQEMKKKIFPIYSNPLKKILKGYISGVEIVPVAVAAILGHVFSPFLKWRGGKGIAVTFGVWSAVTRFNVSIAYAIILAILYILAIILNKGKSTSSEVDGFMVVVGMLTLVLYLYYKSFPMYIYDIWFANLMIITYTNREKLYKLYKDVYEKRHEKNAVTR